jgi:hypothetical protein
LLSFSCFVAGGGRQSLVIVIVWIVETECAWFGSRKVRGSGARHHGFIVYLHVVGPWLLRGIS